MLYLIEILHQTTTPSCILFPVCRCILSKFYIKPQRFCRFGKFHTGCILSKFYIKPQLSYCKCLFQLCCILSKFYIKPQQPGGDQHRTQVVSYRNSTSNHNSSRRIDNPAKLYLIEILHQTTTAETHDVRKKALYLIEILHQTTTSRLNGRTLIRCILSKFYIKPQHDRYAEYSACCCILSKFYIKPQQCPSSMAFPAVVSYRNSTSNHNKAPTFAKRIGVVSYRNSTSNHNLPHARVCSIGLYLIEILHQTTTNSAARLSFPRCILSKFYIKPQQSSDCLICFEVVSYRNSTSNHN